MTAIASMTWLGLISVDGHSDADMIRPPDNEIIRLLGVGNRGVLLSTSCQ